MGGLFGRRSTPTAALGPMPLMAGECQFAQAWAFSVGLAGPRAGEREQHAGQLRQLWFLPLKGGRPVAYTICREHATQFVRYMMMTGNNVIAR